MTTIVSGLLTQKPNNPPQVGAVKYFTWADMGTYIKVKNAKPDEGTPCKIHKAQKTEYSDQYGNVSFNVEFEVLDKAPVAAPHSAPQTHQDAPQRVFNMPDDRQHRIERQHSQEMALRLLEARTRMPNIPPLDVQGIQQFLKNWTDYFQQDIGIQPPL